MITGETPRRATDAELLIWSDFLRRYERSKAAVWYCLKTAELCATMDQFLSQHGIVVWSPLHQARIDKLLTTFNRFGRLIDGVNAQKYYLTIERGEATISAPRKMAKEDYEADQFPGFETLGAWPLVVIVVAIVLLVSANSAVEISGDWARNDARDFQRELIAADQQMATKPADVRSAYLAFKQANAKVIEATAEAAPQADRSIWSKFFSGAKNIAGIAGIALLGFLLLTFLSNKKR